MGGRRNRISRSVKLATALAGLAVGFGAVPAGASAAPTITFCRMNGTGNFLDLSTPTLKVRTQNAIGIEVFTSPFGFATLDLRWGSSAIANFTANPSATNHFVLGNGPGVGWTSITCSTTPPADQGPGASLNTMQLLGKGTYTPAGGGSPQPNHNVDITIEDHGETGANPTTSGIGKDKVNVSVTDPSSVPVLTAQGTLAHGNENMTDDFSGGTTASSSRRGLTVRR
jgi:hypothetical protein